MKVIIWWQSAQLIRKYKYIYAHNIGTAKFIKQILTHVKRKIDINAKVKEFNTLLSAMGRLSRQKMNKEMLDLNHTLEQMGLTDNYGTSQPTAAEYTFLSSTHITFFRTVYRICCKANLRKFKNIEIIPVSVLIIKCKTIMALKHVYHMRNKSSVQVWCRIQEAWGWCTWMTQRDGLGREVRGGSGWGTRVHPWQMHVDVWQNQYNIV